MPITIDVILRASESSYLSENEGHLNKWGEGNTMYSYMVTVI